MSRRKNRKNTEVYQPTYGAGLTGGIGKTVKIIGAILVLIIIIGIAINVGGSDANVIEPTVEQNGMTN